MEKNNKQFQVLMEQDFLDGKTAFTGKILRVNLTTEEIWVDEHPESFYQKWIGGRGLILYYLMKETAPKIDPLGPENLLIFAPGLLTGTILPGTGRHAVGAKSPLTGALASSEAGGWWGAEIKKAGFDGVVIQGIASRPVYLWIKDGSVEIREAEHLWGKTTGDCQEALHAELGDSKVRIAQIGPAGENEVLYASIMHDINRAAGRSGLGAVMGSKNLKAVAVRGTMKVGLADQALVKTTAKWITSNYKDMMSWAISYGTSGSVKFNHDSGATGVRNYQDAVLEGIENIDAATIFPLLIKDRDTCNRCPVRCKLVVGHDGEITIEEKYGGPEYESIGGLGTLCGITDPVIVAKANELCAAYGLDTISTGGTIAFTMNCVQEGLLEGFDFLPTFDDGEALLKSIQLIADRSGIGDWMAEGSYRMAERIGNAAVPFLAVSRKQEFPLHDPRLKNAMGMGYALSATGADHMHNLNDTFATFDGGDVCARLRELGFETPLELWGISDKKIDAYVFETAFKNFLDSAVICHFYPYEYHHMVDALNGAGGWNLDRDDINQIGDRIITLARLYLLREGFTLADDTLSERAYYRLSEGPIAGKSLTPPELADALQRYFKRMNWTETGVPSPEVLTELGLEDFILSAS
jgi:aldehyde:ferredoxin oxidoreductase